MVLPGSEDSATRIVSPFATTRLSIVNDVDVFGALKLEEKAARGSYL